MSNNRIQRIVSVSILTSFIFIGGMIPLYAFCSDNKTESVEAATNKGLTEEVNVQDIKIVLTPAPTATPVPTATPTPTPEPTATPTPTPEHKNLASNGKEYKYYEVYDSVYGSDKWHSLSNKLQEYTYELCIKKDIEEYYTLILCQLFYESQYKADTISETHDYGLAQINRCNHASLREKLGVTDFLDPYQSIKCNNYMMANYLKEVGAEKALLWYNSGNPNTTIKRSWTYKSNIISLWKNHIREKKD